MIDPPLLAALAGSLGAGGLFLATTGARRRPVRIADAFANLEGPPRETAMETAELAGPADSWLERVGAQVYVRGHVPLSETTRTLLRLHGRSIGDFVAEKLVLGTGGLLTPVLLALASATMGAPLGAPVQLAGLVLAVLGWFWPDLGLRRSAGRVRHDADEALLTLFDLVMLERMANRSATQSLEAAAEVSDVAVFRRVRGVLAQAGLEQQQPWSGLRSLAAELRLPALADLADIMQLDDQGASLTEALGARVEELRDAHLSAERIAANEANERMTLWMAVPVMIFGLAFICPPLMRMAGMS
ncbi:hypothetical protein SAMN05443377_12314 [Propionibacterium cyclohexanicum]|uniref:Type II secretion system (T2SS), protein F n=1 Tax=Propionibacterium cyclohexanicum TaxID=64702 RepID=A0A1H9THK6_9ACTN|nr:hypothetical protein [Propionibacterium cyclohexanicum]SER96517.1 hypothetical protein SAMN05443377_12314 [Propionibacterium cyclohexanicum]